MSPDYSDLSSERYFWGGTPTWGGREGCHSLADTGWVALVEPLLTQLAECIVFIEQLLCARNLTSSKIMTALLYEWLFLLHREGNQASESLKGLPKSTQLKGRCLWDSGSGLSGSSNIPHNAVLPWCWCYSIFFYKISTGVAGYLEAMMLSLSCTDRLKA